MERYFIFMCCCLNVYISQSQLHIRYNPCQISHGIFHGNATNNLKICMELQKILNSESNLEKEQGWRYHATWFQSRKDVWMANRHMKRCSTSFIIKEMQIKTTMRSHLLPLKGNYQKTRNNKLWWDGRKKRTLVHIWWLCKLEQLLRKAVWSFLRELKTELSCDWSNDTSEYLS